MIHTGDCLEVMAGMEAESFDAIVTDPPYGLEFMGKEWDRLGDVGQTSHGGIPDRDGTTVFGRTRVSYSGSSNRKCRVCGKWEWAPKATKCNCEEPDFPNARAHQSRLMQDWHQRWAAEALRVAKPGAHLLAFGGTRTYHRLTCALEDAGWEIRDCLVWAYASGFPKSLDVSKAIDKAAEPNVETERRIAVVGELIRQHREAKGMTPQQVSVAIVGTPSGACWNWEHQQLPSVEHWPKIKAALGIPDQFDDLLYGDRSRFIAAEREVVGDSPFAARRPRPGNGTTIHMPAADDITAPATDAAKRWQGWGTALKPAWEPIVLARKPLRGTVAANVQRYGTGAINVDATRIPAEPYSYPTGPKGNVDPTSINFGRIETPVDSHPAGRWPPNLLLTDPELFDMRNDGVVGSGAVANSSGFYEAALRGERDGPASIPLDNGPQYGDTGGYARFFLVPKSSRSDREPPLADYALELHRRSGECDKLRAWGNGDRSQPEQTASTSPGRATSEATGTGSSPSVTSQRGKRSTGRSRPDTRSTTSTATSRTTGSPISSSSIPSLTSGSTPVANSEMGSGGSRAPFVENSSLWTGSIGTYPERDGRTTDGADPAGSGRWSSRNRCGDCGKPLPRFSTHPTQKPTDLMRHLVRLVCPPGGVILDPFAGSGTTGVAATLEGFDFVLIEREPEYVAIAEARLNGVQQGIGL